MTGFFAQSNPVISRADSDYYPPGTSTTRYANTSGKNTAPILTKAYYNEQSDDAEDMLDDLSSTPFLGNLERIKEPFTRSSPTSNLSTESSSEMSQRRKRVETQLYADRQPINRQESSVADFSLELWTVIKRCYILLIIFSFLVALFVLFWQ